MNLDYDVHNDLKSVSIILSLYKKIVILNFLRQKNYFLVKSGMILSARLCR